MLEGKYINTNIFKAFGSEFFFNISRYIYIDVPRTACNIWIHTEWNCSKNWGIFKPGLVIPREDFTNFLICSDHFRILPYIHFEQKWSKKFYKKYLLRIHISFNRLSSFSVIPKELLMTFSNGNKVEWTANGKMTQGRLALTSSEEFSRSGRLGTAKRPLVAISYFLGPFVISIVDLSYFSSHSNGPAALRFFQSGHKHKRCR